MSILGIRKAMLANPRKEGRKLDHPELKKMPEELKEAVAEYLERHRGLEAEILATSVKETTPFTDKSLIVTTYKVYTEWTNLLSVFWFSVSSHSEFNLYRKVEHDSMIAGDIDVFLEHSSWFKGRDQL